MRKALKVTGLAVLALLVLAAATIVFAVIGVLFVVIAASGIIVFAIIGIITPREKLKKIARVIEFSIEDDD